MAQRWTRARWRGWTLVELIVAVALIATLAAIVVPAFLNLIERSHMRRVIIDIRDLEFRVAAFERLQDRLPNDLTELEGGIFIDRWGRSYRYLPSTSKDWKSKSRRDRFLVPLNSDFDLYSMGRDGQSKPPLNVKVSLDDIVRANDGRYVGLAADF